MTDDSPWTLPPHLAPPTDSPAGDPACLEAGRRLFAGPCDFVTSAPTVAALPPTGPVEIAFAGRSNVGKSSLVNALTGRKTLARTSNTPGRTQALNFFELGGVLGLVDMPGYGYARAPKGMVQDWTETVFAYLRGRPSLMRVVLLVDARHGLKDNDRAAMEVLDKAAVVYQVVLTKCDKLRPAGVAPLVEATVAALARHPAAHPVVLPTSSEKGWGLAPVRAEIAALASA